MLQAFRPTPGWDSKRGFPDLRLVWRGVLLEPCTANHVGLLAGVATSPDDDRLAVLLPHVVGFRLLMATLTHPSWPIPIWRALQARNRLLLHRPLRLGGHFDLAVDVSGWRVRDKGIEVDLRTALEQDGALSWESIVTFYYRGRYGTATAHGNADGAPLVAAVVADRCVTTALGRMNGEGRWEFGALTGDYNGIHQWNWYSRRFGFAAAFSHPQRAAALCLLHLPPIVPAPQRLDLWIKGPAYYGSDLVLRHSLRACSSGCDFGLWTAEDPRPSLIGSWDSPSGELCADSGTLSDAAAAKFLGA
jgi:hypothetical protein